MEAKSATTIDPDEIERFSRIAEEWWDPRGKFKPLHVINPLRIAYIRDQILEMQKRRNADSALLTSAPLQGISLLDIGCGGGLISEPMARLGARVTGIDASGKNIKTASLHAEKSGLEIDYRAMPAEDLVSSLRAKRSNPALDRHVADAPRDDGFDIVLALEIIEHVADVDAFVKAACALVKPGGVMVWSTLNRTPKSYALAIVGAEYILRWLPVGTHSWKKFLKPHELVNALRCNDVAVTEMTGMVMNPLNFTWRLDPKDLEVNYLLAGRKLSS